LMQYAQALVAKAGHAVKPAEIFAKILAHNDDAGRHGVVIPVAAYSFFPHLTITDPEQNATASFRVFDAFSASWKNMALKYYQRYPERRITRLNPFINKHADIPRMLVIVRATHADGEPAYYVDVISASQEQQFDRVRDAIFGLGMGTAPDNFIVRPVDAGSFAIDPPLAQLLEKFDTVKAKGWVKTMRAGDTGIGYTFETLLGIKENNDQTADYQGIEIKCKGARADGHLGAGKINLFQAAPIWADKLTARQRIRELGARGNNGLFACHSQVTTIPNNLDLLLAVMDQQEKVDLQKQSRMLGHWPYESLQNRLIEKHSRAVFIKARTQGKGVDMQYQYEELVYCDRPDIRRFIKLLMQDKIVFEFTMRERSNGTVRNHGYPWRLSRADFLGDLFAFRLKLR
ncbi:MAG: hypothetical protein IT447_07085, partial [Phycisphaerales bacterium]|nr:hypothetical protein [Phycisphaerales bacterium]